MDEIKKISDEIKHIPTPMVLPTDTLLVSFDMTHGEDNRILIVGHKEGEYLQIVNAFQGDKAEEIYKLLTTREKKES